MNEFLSTVICTRLRKGKKQPALELQGGTLGLGSWGWSWCPSPMLAQSSSLQAPWPSPCQAWDGGSGRGTEDPAALSSFLLSLGLSWGRWGSRVDSVPSGCDPWRTLEADPIDGLNALPQPKFWGEVAAFAVPMVSFPPLGTDPSQSPLLLSPQKEGLAQARRENRNLLLTGHTNGFLVAVPPLCPQSHCGHIRAAPRPERVEEPTGGRERPPTPRGAAGAGKAACGRPAGGFIQILNC